MLEANGFVTIDPILLDFKTQITVFSNAKHIVAASGAALLNMLWAPKGAEVVVLMNNSKVANYWYFSNIAAALGHKLSYVLGKIENTGAWHDINHADFSIDVSSLYLAIFHIQNTNQSLQNIKLILESKFAFLVHEPSLLSHYRDVWKALGKDKFIIVTTSNFALAKPSLNKLGVNEFMKYVNTHDYLIASFSQVLNMQIKFNYVVTNHKISGITQDFDPNQASKTYPSIRIGKKQIRFMYGADIGDGWSLQSWNEMYDYFLCHGENDRKAIESRFKGKTVIMGYPRYDGYFDPSLNTQSVINEFSLDSGKKTILWMPTLGGDYSSIPRFAEKLKHLIGQYNFIIRPHPISFVQEPDFIALLERCGYSIDRDAIRDMNAIYRVTDVVLADNGGSPFSAIFLGKNVVFLEVPDDLGDNPNSHHIVNTSVNALKQVLPVISENSPETLTELLESEDFYIENCRQIEALFAQYFNCPRGGGAQRVADFLNSLD